MALFKSFDAAVLGELEKQPWWGIDPIKTRDAIELGKYLDPEKYPNSNEYVTALLQSVGKLEALRWQT